jgi:hypothetical protein
VRARDSGGLYLRDDAGTMGIKVADGGSVIVGEDQTPATLFEVRGSTGGLTLSRTSDTASAEPFIQLRHGTSPSSIAQVRGVSTGGMRFTNGAASTEWGRFDAGGLAVGTTGAPAISDGVGIDVTGKILRLRTAKTPASAAATGNTGEICWDTGFLYVCTNTNTWERVAIATW